MDLMVLAEGNHSVRFNRLIGERLGPFLREKNFFSRASAQPEAWNMLIVVGEVRHFWSGKRMVNRKQSPLGILLEYTDAAL